MARSLLLRSSRMRLASSSRRSSSSIASSGGLSPRSLATAASKRLQVLSEGFNIFFNPADAFVTELIDFAGDFAHAVDVVQLCRRGFRLSRWIEPQGVGGGGPLSLPFGLGFDRGQLMLHA